MKSPVLWVTGSLTAATALAATLLIVTTTRSNTRPEFQQSSAINAPVHASPDCQPPHCDAASCAPACQNAD
ncbi:MAG: hypothetical protein WBF99_04425 [Xanthobacteraceae bacterium]